MSAPDLSSERLRFADFTLERLTNAQCRARVCLTWCGSEQFVGKSSGVCSEAGELRCAAEACVNALAQAARADTSLELVGVKAVRAFDATVVIASVAIGVTGDTRRVVGSYLTEGDLPRGAALAVLNATNRILGNRFFMR